MQMHFHEKCIKHLHNILSMYITRKIEKITPKKCRFIEKKIFEKLFHLNAIFLKSHICHLSTHKQSHCIEVAQGGVSSRAIHN